MTKQQWVTWGPGELRDLERAFTEHHGDEWGPPPKCTCEGCKLAFSCIHAWDEACINGRCILEEKGAVTP